MPYVKRTPDGRICGLYSSPREDAREELDPENPEVLRFVESTREHLSSSDSDTIRVIEDLVDVLIRKKVLLLTDLPLAAQQKLMDRQRLRDELGALGNLMVDAEDIL